MKSKNQAVRYDRGSPTIVVVNESSDADASELRRAVSAIQMQADRDFFPLWGWRAELQYEPDRIPPRVMRVAIKDSNKDSDLGYRFIIRTVWGGRANRKRRRHRFEARAKSLRKG